MMTGGSRRRSDSLGPSASWATTRQTKTLHLGCETEDQTLQWARWAPALLRNVQSCFLWRSGWMCVRVVVCFFF